MGIVGQVHSGVQGADDHPAQGEVDETDFVLSSALFGEDAREDGRDEQGHVLEMVAMARFSTLEGRKFGSCKALLETFVVGRSFGVAVVVLLHVAFTGLEDCVAMGESGQEVVQRDADDRDCTAGEFIVAMQTLVIWTYD